MRLKLLTGTVWVAALAYGQMGGYGGIGGFGGLGSRGPGGQPQEGAGIRPWVLVNGNYTNGDYSNAQGVAQQNDTAGVGGLGGLAISKTYKKSYLVGSYMGSYYYNFKTSATNRGMNNAAAVTYGQELTNRITLQLSAFGGSSHGGYGYGGGFGYGPFLGVGSLSNYSSDPSGLGAGSPLQNGIVDSEAFSNRVNWLGSNVSVTYQPTMRWSVTGGGGVSLSRRDSAQLIGMNSYSGFVGTNYLVSRHTSVGAFYAYNYIVYPGLFGQNNVHTMGGTVAHSFSPNTSISGYGGIYNYRSLFIGVVQLDPAISAILGQSSVMQVGAASRWSWAGGAQLSHRIQRYTVTTGYNHGIIPTNGAIFASNRDVAFGGLSYQSSGQWSVGLMGSYYWLKEFQRGVKSEVGYATAFYSYRFFGNFHLTASAGYSMRQPSDVSGKGIGRYASLGIGWSPRELFSF